MKKALCIVLILGFVGLLLLLFFIRYAPNHFGIMTPAPLGIHGIYSLETSDRIYKSRFQKDSLLHMLEKEGLIIKADRLNKYDPPWDSLRYLIGNVYCGNQSIEPYIEFKKDKEDGYTIFQVLWINAAPNASYDTNVYKTLTIKYFRCLEEVLKRNNIQSEKK